MRSRSAPCNALPHLLATLASLFFLLAAVGIARAADAPAPRALERALEALERERWAAARRAVAGLRDPALDDYVEWRRLLNEPDRSFAEIHRFLERRPDWPLARRLQVLGESLIDERVGHRERIAFFARRAPLTRQGRLRYAEALFAAGHRDRAVELLRASWIGDGYSAAEQRFVLERYGSYLRQEDHETRLHRLLWDGAAGEAQRMFGLVDAGHRALAVARLRLQHQVPGVDAAIRAVPRHLVADPGLTFDRLRWRRRKGLADGAREILLGLDEEPFRPSDWWYERAYQVREAIDAERFELAYRLASAHRQTQGVGFAEAEWLAGWLALRFLDRPEAAGTHFERLWNGVSTPISRGRAAYWAGRARATLGRAREAEAWYRRATAFPTTFYGQLAALELGMPTPPVPAPRAAREEATLVAFQEDDRVRLARLLCLAGDSGAAAPFLRRLGADASGEPARLEQVLRLAASCGRPDLVVAIAKRAVREDAIDPVLSYPVPDLPALVAADANLPDPALLLAIARQESHFDPHARSPAGAVGLMQLMPATARAMAGKLGLRFSTARLAGDPQYNLVLGGAYLREQIDRFAGALPLALAAYNAGPPRVASWLRRFGDPRGDDAHAVVDWIERIPFAETRNYVQRVIEGMHVYRALLDAGRYTTVPLAPGGAVADGRGNAREDDA